jgi:hypothetical protein
MALFTPFYNFRGKARNFFVTRRVLWWKAWVVGRDDAERGKHRTGVAEVTERGQPILTLEPAAGQLPTGLNLFQK